MAELYPEFLKDPSVFTCPVHRQFSNSIPIIPVISGLGTSDPAMPTSYSWEVSPRPYQYAYSTPGAESGMTIAQAKQMECDRLGDTVPLARCALHGDFLNVSFGGDVFLSGPSWYNAALQINARSNHVVQQVEFPSPLIRGTRTNGLDSMELACSSNLVALFRAVQTFQRDHRGAMPRYISELVPNYIADTNLLVCPKHRQNPSGFKAPSILTAYKLDDPNLPCSYHWTLNPKVITWTDNSIDFVPGMTLRDLTDRERLRWGDDVPLLRCYAHSPFLAITFGGTTVRNLSDWQIDAAFQRAEKARLETKTFSPAAFPSAPDRPSQAR